MFRFLCSLLLVVGFACAHAATVSFPEVTIDGKDYKDATITWKDGQTAKINHSAGSAQVLVTKLPEDIQSKLGINQDTLSRLEQVRKAGRKRLEESARKEAERKALVAQAEELRVHVVALHPNGMLVHPVTSVEVHSPAVSSYTSRAGNGTRTIGAGSYHLPKVDKSTKYVIAGIKAGKSVLNRDLTLKVIPDGTDNHGTESIPRYKCIEIVKASK